MHLTLSPKPADSSSVDVVTLGENSLDLLAQLPDGTTMPGGKRALRSLKRLTGGQAATAAIGCARLGCRTRYIGRVGDDEAGQRVCRTLAAEGVDLAVEIVTGASTRTAIILVDPSGNREVLEFRDPALDGGSSSADDDVLRRAVEDGRLLLVDASDPRTAARAARLARLAGLVTMVDVDRPGPDTDALLAHIDLLVVSEGFAQAAAPSRGVGEGLAALEARFGPALAIATLGESGALVRQGLHERRVPGFDVAVADTTGAGDAFRAGLATAWLRLGSGADVTTLVTWANAVAALNCREMGAQSGLPTLAEVEALVTLGRARQSK